MTTRSPKVSVVIPSWNAQEWIRETIDSALAQTWKNLEIVVVDDGSADQTVAILKSYGARINVIVQSNSGNSAARNRGISASTGDYVALLDNDDIWLPSKIEAQVRLAEQSAEIGLVFCDYESFAGEPAPNGFARASVLRSLETKRIGADGNIIVDPEAPDRLLEDLYCQIPSTWLLRRQCLLDIGGFEPRLRKGAEDLHLAYRLALRHKLAYSESTLARRREREGSLGRSSNLAVSYARALSMLASDKSISQSRQRQVAARAVSTSHYLIGSLPPRDELSRLLRSISWENAHHLPMAQAARVRLRVIIDALAARIGA